MQMASSKKNKLMLRTLKSDRLSLGLVQKRYHATTVRSMSTKKAVFDEFSVSNWGWSMLVKDLPPRWLPLQMTLPRRTRSIMIYLIWIVSPRSWKSVFWNSDGCLSNFCHAICLWQDMERLFHEIVGDQNGAISLKACWNAKCGKTKKWCYDVMLQM